MVFLLAGSWSNQLTTRGNFLANVMVPRGPVMECHVAPLYWLLGLFKILYSPPDSNRGPPHRPRALTKSPRPLRHALVLIICVGLFIFELNYVLNGGGLGRGLAPTHGYAR